MGMKSILLTRETAPEFKRRLDKLRPNSAPLWGSLTPVKLLRHLRYTIELCLCEVDMSEVKDQSIPVVRSVAWLLFHPPFDRRWPKGKLRAPEYFFPDANGSLDEEMAKLFAAIDRFVDAAEREPDKRALTPLMGMKPLRDWRRINGVHLYHHLRQYGLAD